MNLELIKDAYAIIDGIPKENFDLNDWVYDHKSDTACSISGCGTVACAGGWLSLHPKFRKLGLKYQWTRGQGRGNNYREMVYKGDNSGGAFGVLGKVFGLDYNEAETLFSGSGGSRYDYKIRQKKGQGISHKELFKYRVKHFLKDNDPTYTKSIY